MNRFILPIRNRVAWMRSKWYAVTQSLAHFTTSLDNATYFLFTVCATTRIVATGFRQLWLVAYFFARYWLVEHREHGYDWSDPVFSFQLQKRRAVFFLFQLLERHKQLQQPSTTMNFIMSIVFAALASVNAQIRRPVNGTIFLYRGVNA